MPEFDHDLLSIQEARRLAEAAHEAQRQFAHASQAEVDRACAAMAEAAFAAAERLGRLARRLALGAVRRGSFGIDVGHRLLGLVPQSAAAGE